MSRVFYETAIGICQLNVNEDFHEILLRLMVKAGPLSAVVADVAIGEQSELDEGSEEGNGRNLGTQMWRREVPCVFVEKVRDCSVMALAEEIGFADGFVGQRSVKSEGGRS